MNTEPTLKEAAMAKHTPRPWSQGRTLMTSQTLQWTPEQWVRNQAIERRMVFSHFNFADGGKSRILVAQCDREEDATFIAMAPDILLQLLAAANYIDTLGGDSTSYRVTIAKAQGASND